MKFLIFGAGGLGTYFGALLQQAGNDVHFIARGAHLESMLKNGLQIKSVHGDFNLNKVSASELIPEKEFDFIFICTKSWGVSEAARKIGPHVKKNTSILFFQNGVDALEQVKSHIHVRNILPASAKVVSTLIRPGVIEQKSGVRSITFGELDGNISERCVKLEAALKNANIQGEASHNILAEIWKKFIFISAFSGVTALTRSALGPLLKDPDTFLFYKKCMLESFSLAKAKKIDLPEDLVEVLMEFSKGLEYNLTSSLQEDIQKGRPSELDALTGTIVNQAKEINIETPVNSFIYTALKFIDRQNKEK